MELTNRRLLFAILLVFVTLGALTSAFAQITPSQDSYTNTANPNTNYGTAATLGVVSSAGSIQSTYIQFNLGSIPAGYTSTNVAKATLKLYVNSVNKAGSFNVDFVNGTWSEKTITAGLPPTLGTTIASSVPLKGANVNDYVLIDLTSAVGEWLNGSQANDGIALVANSPLAASFDSKENTLQSHPAELDIIFTSGGTITGVNTANGSGLTGGGTSGSLNLGLLKTCATNQVLQWNGSAWVCASASTGTVDSVGLSAPSSDFTVGGSPVTGTGTLNLGWTVAPTSANTANAIVKRDANGIFSTNGINAGVVSTGELFSVTQAPGGTLVLAQNTATAGTNSYGVYGETDSGDSGSVAVVGVATSLNGGNGVYGSASSAYSQGVLGVNWNNSATRGLGSVGVEGVGAGPHGTGIYGVGTAQSATSGSVNLFYAGAGVWGDTSSPHTAGTTEWAAVVGTADDNYAGYFENNSASGYAAVAAVADNAFELPFVASNSANGQYCYVDAYGDLNCTGSKNAVVPIDGGQRRVSLSAIESPKNWFEDFGSAQLSAGVAVVALEAEFAQTVNTGLEYHVFLTANGDCKGLYVSQKTATSFEVRELGGGASSVSFDYRIVALRKNFENIRMQDHTKDLDPARLRKSSKVVASEKVNPPQTVARPKPAQAIRPIAQKVVR